MEVRIGLLLAACLVVSSISNASVPNPPVGLERTDIGRSPSLGQPDGYNSLIQTTTQSIQLTPQSPSLKALMDGTPEQQILTKPNIKDWGRVPLSFEANRGQSASEVKFVARGPGYTVFLTPTETVLSLRQAVSTQQKDQPIKPGMDTLSRVPAHKPTHTVQSEQPDTPAQEAVIRMKLEGANDKPFIEGAEVLAGKVNYFRGNDPAKWHTDIPTYRKVLYKNVYPGIDHAYYGNPSQLEHDFIVAPGADPGVIRIAFEGLAGKADAPALRLTNEGSLALSVPGGEVLMQKPHVYQEVAGQRVEVAASFILHSQVEGVGLATAQPPSVGFRLASYDQKIPLVIDPVVVYSTYLGGGQIDSGEGIAVDSSGNAYVTGSTYSSNFPTVNAKYPNPVLSYGFLEAFVFKLSGDGQTVLYSTYLGGGQSDSGYGIAVDSSGNAYVTGVTESGDFPTVNAKYPIKGRKADAFVFKLSSNGQTVLYSTYLGGDQSDTGYAIAVDSSSNTYVTGYTLSSDFPTDNAKYPITRGGFDAFVFKLSGDGQTVVYSTYLGGSENESGHGIAVDSSGNAYVTGGTASRNFPTNRPRYPNLGGAEDVFVFKLSGDGQSVLYSTYLGGSSNDYGAGIALDSSGNVYVTGSTYSSDFPTVKAKYPNFGGSNDAFVFKLSGDGQTVLYSTYLGGSSGDTGYGIAVDSSGNAYVTGDTESMNFPTVNAKYPNFRGGATDSFVFKLSGDGQSVLYSTYLGGSSSDRGNGIAVDSSGNAYVTGNTYSSDFLTVNAKYPNSGGVYDAFIATISNQDIGIFGDPRQTAELNGVLDTPVPYVAQPLPDAPVIAATDTRKRNVTVLVHGWNSNPAAWANDTKTIIKNRIGQDRLCDTSNANPCWDVVVRPWDETADTLLPLTAWVAASDVGSDLAKWLVHTYHAQLNHLHLVGHSAGSNVIQHAAHTLEEYKRVNPSGSPKSLHMTFLDPYTPFNKDAELSYGKVDNNLIPTFSDSYVTDDFPPIVLAPFLVDPKLGVGDQLIAQVIYQSTKQHLLNAYNFRISALDTIPLNNLTAVSWSIQNHAWPYQFYQCSANPGVGTFYGDAIERCPVDNDFYDFGFNLSQESIYRQPIETLRRDYRPDGSCYAENTTYCLDADEAARLKGEAARLRKEAIAYVVDGLVHMSQAALSTTGRAAVQIGNQAYDFGSQAFQALGDTLLSQIQRIPLFSGSPVWVRLPVTISEPANFLRFDFKFTEAAEGYLQVFIHGKRIYSADQRYYAPNTVWKSPEIGIGDLEPGTYEIAFRLDPLSDTQSVVELTNLSLGMLQAVDVANQVPTANAGTNRSVRQGSLVTLDGSASADPDNAPQPMSFSWTLAAGPPTAINNPGVMKPSFTPNSVGSYNFNLVVSDGAASSTPAWVTITVPKLGDVDNDGDVDNNDLNQILAARNKPASGPNDLRDLDGNMQIDALDARKLTILCTRPRCATQ